MSNKIQIKYGENQPSKGQLDKAELGFDTLNKKLYIGAGEQEFFLINKIVEIGEDYSEYTVNPIDANTLNGKTEEYLYVGNAKTLNGKSEEFLEVANAKNAFAFNGYTIETFLNKIYPIGAIYESSSNTNPSANFGGTWSLVDKQFKYTNSTSVSDYITLDSTNCSGVTGNIVWNGHVIWCRLEFTPSVAITDTTLSMFTFDLNKLGVTQLYVGKYSSMSDAGQSVFSFSISSQGIFSTTDIIVRDKSDASLEVGYTLSCEFSLYTNPSLMLDSACDKFYWKRTA